jgi:hypothetical protein
LGDCLRFPNLVSLVSEIIAEVRPRQDLPGFRPRLVGGDCPENAELDATLPPVPPSSDTVLHEENLAAGWKHAKRKTRQLIVTDDDRPIRRWDVINAAFVEFHDRLSLSVRTTCRCENWKHTGNTVTGNPG